MNINKASVIIPAYKPDENLLSVISGLKDEGFCDIIVIDDGSGEDFLDIFDRVRKIPECTVLKHETNMGKGAALKTAYAYFLENRKDMAGTVSADADGQHLPKDIAAVAEAMTEKGKVIIGARDFSDPDVPARSKFGNRTTSVVFRLFLGMKISDTQTGLRGIPAKYLPDILKADGNRYEFETNMLFLMKKLDIPFEEVKISTVYLESNKSSHFRPVRDSIKIYSHLIFYILSSAAAALTDIIVFAVLRNFEVLKISLPPSVASSFLGSILSSATWPAALIARVISSLVNYFINSKAVFGKKPAASTVLKYYALAVVIYIVSTGILSVFETLLHISSAFVLTLVKIVVDTTLFFFSFRIQHNWVFNTKKGK